MDSLIRRTHNMVYQGQMTGAVGMAVDERQESAGADQSVAAGAALPRPIWWASAAAVVVLAAVVGHGVAAGDDGVSSCIEPRAAYAQKSADAKSLDARTLDHSRGGMSIYLARDELKQVQRQRAHLLSAWPSCFTPSDVATARAYLDEPVD